MNGFQTRGWGIKAHDRASTTTKKNANSYEGKTTTRGDGKRAGGRRGGGGAGGRGGLRRGAALSAHEAARSGRPSAGGGRFRDAGSGPAAAPPRLRDRRA